MDGSFPLQRDPAIASPPPDIAGWQQEIDNARAGKPPSLSTKAAAFYLGVHYKTLLAWVREGCGPQPIKNPARPGTNALNQRMRFTLEALDAYQQARTGSLITRGARSDTEALRREAERIQAIIDLKAAQDQLAKARERAKRHGVVCFASLADLTEVHPWARVNDRLVGHAWTVDDDVLESAGDDLVETTLEEALLLPWASANHQAPYLSALELVLTQAQTGIEIAKRSQSVRDLQESLPAAGPGKRTTIRL